MPSLSQLVPTRASSRVWLSTIASMLIVASFAAFYLQRYQEARKDAAARSVRLLATGAEGVRKAAMGDSHLVVDHPQCANGIRIEPPLPVEAGASNAKPASSKPDGAVCLPFDSVLGLVPKGNTLFDKLMLVDGEDAVLARMGSSSTPNLLSLHELRVLDVEGKKLAEHAKQKDFGHAALVESGSERSQLACQPLTNSVLKRSDDDKTTPMTLHLCGMVSEARLVKDAVRVSPVFVVLFSVLLTCALLIPPFLKTALLSFTERLSFVDVVTVGLCVFSWLMLTTVVGLGVYTYLYFRSDSIAELQTQSQAVSNEVRSEVAQWRKLVSSLDVRAFGPSGKHPCPTPCETIEAIAVTDLQGTQLSKWKMSEGSLLEARPLVNVSARPYFKAALAGKAGEVVVDSVTTFTTGETRVVYARKVKDEILTVTTRLWALSRPRPARIGFALVDRSGWVAFHSENALSNSHNLFEETDQNAKLQQLVSTPSASGQIDDLSYWGIDHQAFVTSPPAGSAAPWSVVTFAEAEPLRKVVFFGGTDALLRCGAYLLLCALIFGIFVGVGRKTLAWAWPSPQCERAYRFLGGSYLFLGLASIAAEVAWPALGFGIALVLPAALVGATWLVYRSVPPRSDWTSRASSISHLGAFQLSSGVFWFVVTAVPASAIALRTMNGGLREGGRSLHFVWHLAWVPAATLALDLIITVIVVFWGLRTVFLGGLERAPSKTWQEIFDASANSERRPRWCVVASAAQLEQARELRGAASPHAAPVYVDSVQSLATALIGARSSEPPVVLVSPRTPRQLLELASHERDSATAANWAAQLAGWEIIYVPSTAAAQQRTDATRLAAKLLGSDEEGAWWWKNRRQRWLVRELEVNPHVLAACERNLAAGSLAGADEAELRRLVRDACWQYYFGVWQACSPIERLTLLQLSQEAFVNQKRIDVVRDLLSRGILMRRPMLAPMTDSLGMFACTMGEQEHLETLEVSSHRLSWDTLKVPLFTLLVCSAGAFFYTQRALFDSTLVFATTITSLLPQIGRWVALLGVTQVRGGSAAPLPTAVV